MNDLKIQQEVLKAILANPQQVRYFSYDLDQVFVTTTGTVGYFMPVDALRVNLTGAQIMADILTDEIADAVQVGNRLVGTDEYRKGGVARKYLRHRSPEKLQLPRALPALPQSAGPHHCDGARGRGERSPGSRDSNAHKSRRRKPIKTHIKGV